MIKIDKDIPTPRPAEGRPRKYPFPDMVVGDSFAVPLAGEGHAQERRPSRCQAARQRHPLHARVHGGKFTVRTDREAGVARCWRTE
jgi:hypothetical protein